MELQNCFFLRCSGGRFTFASIFTFYNGSGVIVNSLSAYKLRAAFYFSCVLVVYHRAKLPMSLASIVHYLASYWLQRSINEGH